MAGKRVTARGGKEEGSRGRREEKEPKTRSRVKGKGGNQATTKTNTWGKKKRKGTDQEQ